jgi:hypothetical protein
MGLGSKSFLIIKNIYIYIYIFGIINFCDYKKLNILKNK